MLHDVLRDKDGDLAMVFGSQKSGFILTTNRAHRLLTDIPYMPMELTLENITKWRLRRDCGEWMAIKSSGTTFHKTYADAKMSDLFGIPCILYLSEEEVKAIETFEAT